MSKRKEIVVNIDYVEGMGELYFLYIGWEGFFGDGRHALIYNDLPPRGIEVKLRMVYEFLPAKKGWKDINYDYNKLSALIKLGRYGTELETAFHDLEKTFRVWLQEDKQLRIICNSPIVIEKALSFLFADSWSYWVEKLDIEFVSVMNQESFLNKKFLYSDNGLYFQEDNGITMVYNKINEIPEYPKPVNFHNYLRYTKRMRRLSKFIYNCNKKLLPHG